MSSFGWRLSSMLAVAACLAVVVLGGAGCGGATAESSVSPAGGNLLSNKEIEKFPAGSTERAFMSFWSDLQFQSWAEVARYYDPELRERIGTADLIAAKKLNGSTYQTLKPVVVRVKRGDQDTTVYYSLLLADGAKELASTTWRKNEGNWQLIYDSRLDAELNQLAQNRVTIDENGSLPTDPSQEPSAKALRAGTEASQLQAKFLSKLLNEQKP